MGFSLLINCAFVHTWVWRWSARDDCAMRLYAYQVLEFDELGIWLNEGAAVENWADAPAEAASC